MSNDKIYIDPSRYTPVPSQSDRNTTVFYDHETSSTVTVPKKEIENPGGFWPKPTPKK